MSRYAASNRGAITGSGAGGSAGAANATAGGPERAGAGSGACCGAGTRIASGRGAVAGAGAGSGVTGAGEDVLICTAGRDGVNGTDGLDSAGVMKLTVTGSGACVRSGFICAIAAINRT